MARDVDAPIIKAGRLVAQNKLYRTPLRLKDGYYSNSMLKAPQITKPSPCSSHALLIADAGTLLTMLYHRSFVSLGQARASRKQMWAYWA
jgi:hypothetical protein